MVIRRIARPLLSVAFIGQGVESLLNPKAAAEAAAPAVDGLQALPDQVARSMPNDPQTFAQITAGVQIGGGLLLATGKMPRVASAVLALTVLPANFGSYSFWNESDPQRKAERRREFLKDLSLLGGLMIASADTAGKPSLGWRGRKAAERLSDRVSSVLPGSDDALFDADFAELGEKIAHGLHVGAERGRELASTAAERSAPYAEAALDRGRELANTAAERGAPYAELALDRGRELASAAAERAEPLAKKARKRGEQLADEVAERAEKARKRSEKLAEEAAEKAGPLAKKARKRSEKLAKKARVRGEDFAETARTHGNQLADAARDRVGGQVKTRRRPW
ncbi:DoxX family membrane protein [Mycobacterium ahvazicum]|uniref:DoxX family membrane protein n=1 Tax=Mycobacterium ahvazicum TaxID=1964395 RepID=A0A2K4YCF3_9MYCO|nr:DoxX family protein [Mycobacterium ahvazicum]SOX54461.1 DoxX family membrane protein [Mycobacterium ahvazicum]